jgi:hypothetical protein
MNAAVSTTHPTATQARAQKRAAAVRAQRRAGNGTVEDLAEFCCVALRTAQDWKTSGVVGHTQIGGNIWLSADDVAEFVAAHHHAGKYSSTHATQTKDQVRKDWREFLCAIERDEDRFARIEVAIFGSGDAATGNFLGTAAATVKASHSPGVVDHAAVPFKSSTKAAA